MTQYLELLKFHKDWYFQPLLKMYLVIQVSQILQEITKPKFRFYYRKSLTKLQHNTQ